MQLVAYGAQDVYLTAEPTITFWKAVYRRHTNFAMESMVQTMNGTSAFGNSTTCRISRNGDLMGRCYLEATLPVLSASESWCNRVGFRLLNQVELRVGGQIIDRHYSNWMYIWTELTHTADQKNVLNKLVGETERAGGANTNDASTTLTLNIPLLFAFCRHPGLALPLIALQYHEVEIRFTYSTRPQCLSTGASSVSGAGDLSGVQLWVDYIFLDTDERKEFAQKPHEYLIEIVQSQDTSFSSSSQSTNTTRLTFNHPTKFLTWVMRDTTDDSIDTLDSFTDFTYGDSGLNSVSSSKILLNGQDRFQERSGVYFNYVQPYQHFSGYPDEGINVYSFAIKPEEHQPSGSCNLSRIDNVNLNIVPNLTSGIATNYSLSVYGFSYNVFRVASGMGGLAYSN